MSGQRNQQLESPHVWLAAGRERRPLWLELGETDNYVIHLVALVDLAPSRVYLCHKLFSIRMV